MEKIVITGGAGFIGSHVAEYWINQGAQVVVIDNLRTGKVENLSHLPTVTFVNDCVTNQEILHRYLQNARAVYHYASLVSVPESFEIPKVCYEINTFGLLNIIAICLQQPQTKIVYSSSAAVYGNNPNLPLQTNAAAIPLSPYGDAKLSGEYLLQQYHAENNLRYVACRHFNVFGPRQDPKGAYASVIPLFITRALRNEDIIIYGDGEQIRDFIYVKDVVKANVLAADNAQVNGVFNVASGKEISVNKLAEIIIRLVGSKSRIVHHERRKGDIQISSADITTTTAKLGFEPSYSIEEGLMETIEYFRKLPI